MCVRVRVCMCVCVFVCACACACAYAYAYACECEYECVDLYGQSVYIFIANSTAVDDMSLCPIISVIISSSIVRER